MMAAPDTVLELQDVTAGYGDLPAVRDISLSIRAGEIVALFGPNGAGKSTTLLAAMGELPVQKGEIRWWSQPRKRAIHQLAQAGVAYVPEGRSTLMGMSVKDNLLLGAGGIEPAVEYFPELSRLMGRRAGLLSGGEQQMLVLARALASEPKVLLADELALGLAPIIVDRLLDALRQAVDNGGIAVLLVEQQARRALSLASRWYLLRNGRMVAEGDSADGVDALEASYLN